VDRARLDAGQQQRPQVGPVHFRGVLVPVGGDVPLVDGAVLVQDQHVLAFRPGPGQKRIKQAGPGQRGLPGLALHVQRPALVAGVGSRVALVDGHLDPGLLEDPGAGQTARAGADDGDTRWAGGHQLLPLVVTPGRVVTLPDKALLILKLDLL
jgi:hypothetical protein